MVSERVVALTAVEVDWFHTINLSLMVSLNLQSLTQNIIPDIVLP